MHKPPAPLTGSLVFDLDAIAAELRDEEAYRSGGHAARTLVREPDLRLVLIAVRASCRIAEHSADEIVAITLRAGQVALALPTGKVALMPGQCLVLEPGVQHDVEAGADSTLLLTLGGKARK
jgi:quercetin dioxygenase-like cupin family protein